MGKELLDWMLDFPEGRYRSSAEMLIDRFGKSPNIEDLITDLEVAIKSLDTEKTEDRIRRSLLANSRGQLGEALREWFREIHLRPAPGYAEFAHKIAKGGDVILTFNYDDSLERELKAANKWDVCHGYGFPLCGSERVSNILVLKLHGSINWLALLFGGATSGPIAVGPDLSLGQHPVVHRADLEYLGYSDLDGHTYPGGGAFPSLILPARSKQFFYETSFGQEWMGFWEGLWSRASAALACADKLILCGYSLLAVDQRARDLLLGVPDRQTPVTIVSGSQSERIASDFKSVGFTDVVFRSEYFEQWLRLPEIQR